MPPLLFYKFYDNSLFHLIIANFLCGAPEGGGA